MPSFLSRLKKDGGNFLPPSSPPRSPGASNPATRTPTEATPPLGLEVVSEGTNPVLDVVAVHGLNGHRERTWTSSNGVHWLRDLIPRDLPSARVMCWGYGAQTHDRSRLSCQYLYDHAQSLVSDLCLHRELSNTTTRPIVFIAHSLGGIIVKSALIHSDAARQGALEKHRSVKTSTYGIIFMGTPHQGGNGVRLGQLLVNIASVFVAANDRILGHLERDSEWLQQQLWQYGPISGDFVTKFAYETYKTPTILGRSLQVVPKESAVVPGQANAEPIAIHADHVNMVRFESTQNPGYKTISGHLRIMARDASAKISSNWSEEGNGLEDFPDDLANWRVIDPRHDKARIQSTKGGLLRDSYKWILDHVEFQQWRDNRASQVLWIRGGPGKGKTMLLIGIIDELAGTIPLSFSFCQASDDRLNSAAAVLRGLVYLLLKQRRGLVSHLRNKDFHADLVLSDNKNSFHALSQIFKDILRDPLSEGAYLIVDALDECKTGQAQLLDLIIQTALEPSMRIKWLVSGRYVPSMEDMLRHTTVCTTLSLEHSPEHVSSAVDTYIDWKISRLASLQQDESVREHVRDRIRQKANGTFLWVSVVFRELQDADCRDVLNLVDDVQPGIVPLYRRILTQIQDLDEQNHRLCFMVLATATVAYRPLHLLELGSITSLPESVSSDTLQLDLLVKRCGSFLEVQDNRVYFIHDSAREYLHQEANSILFPFGIAQAQYGVFSRSCRAMSSTLRRDIYNIGHPGVSVDQVGKVDPDPLVAVKYACSHWVDHLLEVDLGSPQYREALDERGPVDSVLRQSCLYWLEALSLTESLSDSVIAITKLEAAAAIHETGLLHLVRDVRRFILRNRTLIEETPLQTYAAALLFSPAGSLTRAIFGGEEPRWITNRPVVESTWGACLQTLEGHVDGFVTAAFSHDSRLVVSSSSDNTARIWDTTTGACMRILAGEHTRGINSAVFSHDARLIASGSSDCTAKIWDITTGRCEQTLHHSKSVKSVSFSHDSHLVASASSDKTIRIWDVATGECMRELQAHTDAVRSVAFSHDSQRLVSASDKTVKIWDAVTFVCTWALRHGADVKSAIFSHDSQLVASSSDETIRIWSVATGECVQVLQDNVKVWSAVFSHDSSLIVSASDTNIKIWDVARGECTQLLEGHTGGVRSVAFSHDSRLVLSASTDRTVKVWDTTIETSTQIECHEQQVQSVAFSPDSLLVASTSRDRTIKLWDATTGQYSSTLTGHTESILSVAFSPDGTLIASASRDKTVKVWSVAEGECIQTLSDYMGSAYSAVFSHDSRLILLPSDDTTVKIWDVRRGVCKDTLKGHSRRVRSAAFSNDSRVVASASDDKTVKIWDTVTGSCTWTLEGHSAPVILVAISQNQQLVGSTSEGGTLKIWDIIKGECIHTRNVGIRLTHMSFDPTASYLLSDMGFIDVRPLIPEPNVQAQERDAPMMYGFSLDLSWITWNGQKVLWLPTEYRPSCCSISGSTIAVGCLSGKVFVLSFSLHTTPVLPHTSQSIQVPGHTTQQRVLGARQVDLTVIRDLSWMADQCIFSTSGTADWSPCLQILEAQSDTYFMSVAYSPDSNIIASADGNLVQLWGADNGALLHTLRGHTDAVMSVTFSADSKQLISTSEDRTMRFWDTRTGNLLRLLQGRLRSWSVAFSPDGRQLVSGSPDSIGVEVWDSRTGRILKTLRGHTDVVFSVGFSSNSLWIASGSVDKTVRLWRAGSGELVHTLEHKELVSSVAFSPDSRWLSSGSLDGRLQIWDVNTGAQLKSLFACSAVRSVSFSTDSCMIASGAADGKVELWDAGSGTLLDTLRGHADQITSIAFSPDSQRVMSSSMDKTIRIWETDKGIGAMLNIHRENVNRVSSVAISPDSQRIAATSGEKTIRLWNGDTGALLDTLRGHRDQVHLVMFSPDSERLASASADGTVRLWNGRTGTPTRVLRGHTDPVCSLAFSPNLRWLASVSVDKTVQIWNAGTGVILHKLRGHSGVVGALDISPDSRLLASASADGTLRVWNIEAGSQQNILHEPHPIWSVAFSPNGRWLVSGSADGTVQLCEARTGERRRRLQAHTSAVTSIVISSDSRLLASGSYDSTIRLYDLDSSEPLCTLRRHSGAIRSIALSANLRWLASGSDDGTVRLWDVSSAIPLSKLEGYGPILSVTFSANSRWLASADPDGTLRLCSAETGAPLRTLRDNIGLNSLRPYASREYGRLFAQKMVDEDSKRLKAAEEESLRLGAMLGTLRPEYHHQVISEGVSPRG